MTNQKLRLFNNHFKKHRYPLLRKSLKLKKRPYLRKLQARLSLTIRQSY